MFLHYLYLVTISILILHQLSSLKCLHLVVTSILFLHQISVPSYLYLVTISILFLHQLSCLKCLVVTSILNSLECREQFEALNLAEDLDIRPEILFSSAWTLFAPLKGRANKDQNFLFIFHYSHSA